MQRRSQRCARRCRRPALPKRRLFCPRMASNAASPMPNRWRRNSTKVLGRELRISKTPTRNGRRIIRARSAGATASGWLHTTSSPRTRRCGACTSGAPVIEFVSAVLERAPLYRYADPMGALNLAVMGDGDELQWHYDQTDFVVSLALRDADVGGDFEVAPKLRSATDENYPGVSRVLAGDSDAVTRLPMTPGTLLIFAGRHSLHRVSPIAGRNRAAGRVTRLRHATRHAAARRICSANATAESRPDHFRIAGARRFRRARRPAIAAATAARASHRRTPRRAAARPVDADNRNTTGAYIASAMPNRPNRNGRTHGRRATARPDFETRSISAWQLRTLRRPASMVRGSATVHRHLRCAASANSGVHFGADARACARARDRSANRRSRPSFRDVFADRERVPYVSAPSCRIGTLR